MTSKEAAEFLGWSVQTLYRRIADGSIQPLPTTPGLKRPKKLLFRREDVEKLATPHDQQ